MPEHHRAVDGSGRRRGPAACDAGVEQFVGGWLVVPPGEPVDRAESGRVEAQVRAGAFADEHVVRELVLHDHVDDLGAVHAAPREQLFERRELHKYCCSRGQYQRWYWATNCSCVPQRGQLWTCGGG